MQDCKNLKIYIQKKTLRHLQKPVNVKYYFGETFLKKCQPFPNLVKSFFFNRCFSDCKAEGSDFKGNH